MLKHHLFSLFPWCRPQFVVAAGAGGSGAAKQVGRGKQPVKGKGKQQMGKKQQQGKRKRGGDAPLRRSTRRVSDKAGSYAEDDDEEEDESKDKEEDEPEEEAEEEDEEEEAEELVLTEDSVLAFSGYEDELKLQSPVNGLAWRHNMEAHELVEIPQEPAHTTGLCDGNTDVETLTFSRVVSLPPECLRSTLQDAKTRGLPKGLGAPGEVCQVLLVSLTEDLVVLVSDFRGLVECFYSLFGLFGVGLVAGLASGLSLLPLVSVICLCFHQ